MEAKRLRLAPGLHRFVSGARSFHEGRCEPVDAEQVPPVVAYINRLPPQALQLVLAWTGLRGAACAALVNTSFADAARAVSRSPILLARALLVDHATNDTPAWTPLPTPRPSRAGVQLTVDRGVVRTLYGDGSRHSIDVDEGMEAVVIELADLTRNGGDTDTAAPTTARACPPTTPPRPAGTCTSRQAPCALSPHAHVLLGAAAAAGHERVAAVAISMGAHLLGDALLQACRAGRRGVVAMLLRRGADPNTAEPFGPCALVEAARAGFCDIAQLLLDSGAAVNGPPQEEVVSPAVAPAMAAWGEEARGPPSGTPSVVARACVQPVAPLAPQPRAPRTFALIASSGVSSWQPAAGSSSSSNSGCKAYDPTAAAAGGDPDPMAIRASAADPCELLPHVPRGGRSGAVRGGPGGPCTWGLACVVPATSLPTGDDAANNSRLPLQAATSRRLHASPVPSVPARLPSPFPVRRRAPAPASPLLAACARGQAAAVRLLLARSAAVDAVHGAELHLAANAAVVDELLAVRPSLLPHLGPALSSHAAANRPAVVAALLRHGADPLHADGAGLTEAAFKGHDRVVELLLEAGRERLRSTRAVANALQFAVRWERASVVERLLRFAADSTAAQEA